MGIVTRLTDQRRYLRRLDQVQKTRLGELITEAIASGDHVQLVEHIAWLRALGMCWAQVLDEAEDDYDNRPRQ